MVPFFSRFRRDIGALFTGKPPASPRKEKSEPRKKDTEEKDLSGPNFAFVCLNSPRIPTESELKEKIAKWYRLDSTDQIADFELSDGKFAGMDAMSFQLGDHIVVIAQMPMPIPKPDIEYACANAVLWRDAAEVVAKHTSHLIVSVNGEFQSPLEEAMFLSCSVAACTEAFDACAVYWGHATVVHRPEFFREQITQVEQGSLPVLAWVGFLLARGSAKGTLDVYTRGLEVFGVMEIEVVGSRRELFDVLGRVADLSSYLLKNGNVIGDGHTLGDTDAERIRAHHAESAIGREGKVLRIDL